MKQRKHSPFGAWLRIQKSQSIIAALARQAKPSPIIVQVLETESQFLPTLPGSYLALQLKGSLLGEGMAESGAGVKRGISLKFLPTRELNLIPLEYH